MDTMHAARVTCDVPVFYATTEGQTRRIAIYLADALKKAGIDSRAIDVSSSAADHVEWSRVRASIVGASVHGGRHQRAAKLFIKAHAFHLNARPSAFFSVSLSAGSKQSLEVKAAQSLAEKFPIAQRWHPDRVVCFAGRLAYSQYGFLKRLVMQRISRKEGAPTDTSRDYEFTNWGDVDQLAEEIKGFLQKQAARTSAA
jgi:menaquinone-dependent protoporphyrinogen oxidase